MTDEAYIGEIDVLGHESRLSVIRYVPEQEPDDLYGLSPLAIVRSFSTCWERVLFIELDVYREFNFDRVNVVVK